MMEHVGGNDTVTQEFFLPLCAGWGHLFASSHWHADTGCWVEAFDTTRSYVMQQGSKERHTVSLTPSVIYQEKRHHGRYVHSAQGLNTSPSHLANCCTIVMASVTVIIAAASRSRVSLSSMGFFLPG